MATISRFPAREPADGGVPWRRVFHAVRMPLWLLDLSAVYQTVGASAPRGRDAFAAWLDVHPEFITRMVAAIKVVDVNDAAVDLFAASGREELVISLDRLVLPETLAAFKSLILAVGEKAETVEYDAEFRSLTDRAVHTICRGWLPPCDSPGVPMVLAMIDVSDLKHSARGLARSEGRYRALLDGAGDLILRHDLDGNITFINQAGLEMLGFARNEVLGRNAMEMVPLNQRETIRQRRSLRRSGDAKGLIYETVILARDGREVPFEIHSKVVHDPLLDGGDPQVLLCGRNLTDRRRGEREQIVLDARLQVAQKLESLGTLAGGVAHKFNNMLGAIMGNVELVSTLVPTGSESQARLDTVLEVATEAADLCRQLQVYAGEPAAQRQLLDLSAVVAGSSGLLEVATGGAAGVHFQLAADLPPVAGDEVALRQVVLNLVTNAAQACTGRGGEIVVRTGVRDVPEEERRSHPLLKRLTADRCVFCEVRDSGAGMAEHEARRIFDPFYSTRAEGRGMGLAAAMGVIRAHGGGFALDTQAGRGTTITFLLPVAPAEGETDARAQDVRREAAPPDLNGRVILVIERDAQLRGVAVSLLRRLGCRPLAAGDGFEGVRIFGLRHAEIDAAIVDLHMDGLDGPETCRRLRVIDPDVPVVFASGSAPREVAASIAGIDRAGVLAKPFKLLQIQSALGETLGPPDASWARD